MTDSMILITTPTGTIGKFVLSELLSGPSKIRLYLRNPSKLGSEEKARCEVVQGDLLDLTAFTKACQGIDTVFYSVPQCRTHNDVREYYRSFYNVAVKAFKEGGVKRIVLLSGGRGNPDDLGTRGPFAEMEKAFDETGIATRHIRCGFCMEIAMKWVPQMKFTGSFSIPVDGDYTIAFESSKDIGKTAARLLSDSSWTDQQFSYVDFNDPKSPNEIAAILSKVFERKITFKYITGEEYKSILIKYKVSPAMAQAIKEMYEDIDNGSLSGKRPSPTENGLTFEEWATINLKPKMSWFSIIKSMIFH